MFHHGDVVDEERPSTRAVEEGIRLYAIYSPIGGSYNGAILAYTHIFMGILAHIVYAPFYVRIQHWLDRMEMRMVDVSRLMESKRSA